MAKKELRYPVPFWMNGNLSIIDQKQLISIMKALQAANDVILSRLEDNLNYWNANQGKGRGFYKEEDRIALQRVKNLNLSELDSNLQDLYSALADTSYIRIWRKTIEHLIVYQGSDYKASSWRQSKWEALDILEQRDKAVHLLSNIEEELKVQAYDVYDGINTKIRILERFTIVYDTQPSPLTTEDRPPTEPTYKLWSPEKKHENQTIFDAYPQPQQQQQNHPSTLIAVVSLTTIIAILPLGFAWKLSSNATGSTEDVDFYLLIQSSVMNLIGIFTAIYPTFRQKSSSGKRWAEVFAFLGVSCATAAIPMYLYLPTMWSAFVSFIGTAIQSFMAMQLAMTVDSSNLPLK